MTTRVHTLADLTARGLRQSEIRRMLASGELTRLTPGFYACTDGVSPGERYRLRVQAVGMQPGFRGVISHDSAAALHRLGLLHPDDVRVHSTAPNTGTHRAGRATHRGDAPWTLVDGVRATTLARTAIDVARASPSPSASRTASHGCC